MSSGILFHGELHLVLHVMLAEHRVTAGSRCDLLHPVLLLAFHLSVVIDLTESRKDWQLSRIDNLTDR